MGFTRSLAIVCIAGQAIMSTAIAGEPAGSHSTQPAPSDRKHPSRQAVNDTRKTPTPLDRVATAVDGAESSHGADLAMWRPDPSGPQGPMQVSEAAATDVGGGDRFDMAENRAIGRAYLLQLFWRYRNWPDAIAAYNWGIGKMDAWVKAGRPSDKLLGGVAVYLKRVLHESGLCEDLGTKSEPQNGAAGAREPAALPADALSSACSAPDGPGGEFSPPGRFYSRLEAGLRLALQRAAQNR